MNSIKYPNFLRISKSERKLKKNVQLKKEIFSLREKIKQKLNISSIPEFEKKISINNLRDNLNNKQVIISLFYYNDNDLYIKFISKDDLSFKKIKNKQIQK